MCQSTPRTPPGHDAAWNVLGGAGAGGHSITIWPPVGPPDIHSGGRCTPVDHGRESYIDDFIIVGAPGSLECARNSDLMHRLCERVGLPAEPLLTRGTFGDPGSNPGSNPGADNFFFVFECFFLFFHMLSFFSTCLVFFPHALLHKLLFYLVCMVEKPKKKKLSALGLEPGSPKVPRDVVQ